MKITVINAEKINSKHHALEDNLLTIRIETRSIFGRVKKRIMEVYGFSICWYDYKTGERLCSLEDTITNAFERFEHKPNSARSNRLIAYNRLDIDAEVYNALCIAAETMETHANSLILERWRGACKSLCGKEYPKRASR